MTDAILPETEAQRHIRLAARADLIGWKLRNGYEYDGPAYREVLEPLAERILRTLTGRRYAFITLNPWFGDRVEVRASQRLNPPSRRQWSDRSTVAPVRVGRDANGLPVCVDLSDTYGLTTIRGRQSIHALGDAYGQLPTWGTSHVHLDRIDRDSPQIEIRTYNGTLDDRPGGPPWIIRWLLVPETPYWADEEPARYPER